VVSGWSLLLRNVVLRSMREHVPGGLRDGAGSGRPSGRIPVLGLLSSGEKETVMLGWAAIVGFGVLWALLGQVVALRYLHRVSPLGMPTGAARHTLMSLGTVTDLSSPKPPVVTLVRRSGPRYRHQLCSWDVPQPYCLVKAAAGQGVSIGAERHRVDRA
jgi:hypothetical protein